MSDIVPLELVGVRIELPTNTPILLLREPGTERYLPIWIGTPEATASARSHEGGATDRPLTHDLLENVIQITDGNIERIIITRVEENVFYATILIKQNGSVREIDARPSDSIVMALKRPSRNAAYLWEFATRSR